MPINMNSIIKIAIKASIQAGIETMKIYKNDFEIELKSDDSPLTIADKKANKIIMSFLEKTNIPIISEENKQVEYCTRKKWTKCWIVDPLDGTKEFIKKNGEFTVNIALVYNNKPQLGVIYVPVTKELYFGNVLKNKSYKIIVDDTFDVKELFQEKNEISPKITDKLRIVGSRSHMNKETEEFVKSFSDIKIEIIPKGSSLKFCLIAEGKADIYPRFAPTMEWDTAAGQAICESVGLQVISKETNMPLLYNKENLLNPHFIVNK